MTRIAKPPTTPRVLLVDDDSISLELTAILLAADGTQVERALGGQQALDRLRAPSPLPDVVLVDRQMPGVSGVDVARVIQALPAPRPRIIAMSATALPQAERAVFDDALLKPLDRDQLRAAVSGTRSGDATSAASEELTLPATLDQGRIRKLQQIMPPEAIHELYTVYVADTRQRLDELERCSAAGDVPGLRRCAHALKGSAAMAGVVGIATIAAGLEAGQLPQQEYSMLFLEMRKACDDVERSMTGGTTPGEIR